MKGGRFNRIGQPALYLSTDFVTAVMEYCQGVISRLQPVLACRYDVAVEDIVDLSTDEVRATNDTTLEELACPWALLAAQGKTPPSWTMIDLLMSAGASGILVPSFVPHAGEDAKNLVLWHWGPNPPHRVIAVDDDGRLPKGR